MSLDRKLDQVLGRFNEIEALMCSGTLASDNFSKLSKEYSDLTPLTTRIRDFKKAKAEMKDLESLMAGTDKEMQEMAEADFYRLKERLSQLEKEIQLTLVPKDETDAKNAILEIRAGTGGDEAALFAGDLFSMYRRYAADHGWRFEVMEMSESDLGGI